MCSTEVGYGYKSILQIKRGKIALLPSVASKIRRADFPKE